MNTRMCVFCAGFSIFEQLLLVGVTAVSLNQEQPALCGTSSHMRMVMKRQDRLVSLVS